MAISDPDGGGLGGSLLQKDQEGRDGEIFGTQVAYLERFRVVAHEAAHLAFFSDDETFANSAAEYCIGQSQINPFGNPV